MVDHPVLELSWIYNKALQIAFVKHRFLQLFTFDWVLSALILLNLPKLYFIFKFFMNEKA